MAKNSCVVKGCRYIVTCINGGIEAPLGLISSSTLNSSRADGESNQYLGGNYVEAQDDANFIPRPEEMFQLPNAAGDPEGAWYFSCGTTAASCTHELTINGDYCFEVDPSGQIVRENIEEFQCERIKQVLIRRHTPANGRLDIVFRGTGLVESKNRTLTGGQETNSNFAITLSMQSETVEFLNGFH